MNTAQEIVFFTHTKKIKKMVQHEKTRKTKSNWKNKFFWQAETNIEQNKIYSA